MSAAIQSTSDVRWTRTLTGIGIAIAVFNMALAWVVMFSPPMPDHAASVQAPSASAATPVQTPSATVTPEATAADAAVLEATSVQQH